MRNSKMSYFSSKNEPQIRVNDKRKGVLTEGEKEKPRKEKKMLIADKAINREDRGDSIVDRADPTQYKDFVPWPFRVDDDKASIPFETLIETLREVHSKDEDSISVIQRFEEIAIDYWKNDIDLNLFSKVDSTTQHVNHASVNSKILIKPYKKVWITHNVYYSISCLH
jgi:hypothetical protein